MALTVAAGCSRGAGDGDLVIGEYGSLTGSEANFGQSNHNGVVMAVDEINATGGIGGRHVRVITYDDQGKTSEVGTAVTRLIRSDHALVVIGEVSSSLSIAGGQICQQNGVPMISPSSTNAQVTDAGDYVFRVCFTDPFQGWAMAKFTTMPPSEKGLGLKRVAVLIDERQAYSQGLGRDYEAALRRMGGVVVARESYQGGDQDFSAQLARVKDARPDALFVPGYYTDIANIAKQARGLGITAPLLGGDGWESVTEMGTGAMAGAYYANHYNTDDPDPRVRAFVDKYKARFGRVPDSMAALAYDAVMLVRHASRTVRGPLDRRSLRDALARTVDFPGVTGNITIDAHRDARKPATIIRIEGATGAQTVTAATIEPPPEGELPVEGAPEEVVADEIGGGAHRIAQLVFKGISVGSLYALIALGYTMVYGILQFINFAHSDVFMLGAFLSWRISTMLGWARLGPLQATGLLLVAMGLCAIVGFLIERLAYRPLRRAPRLNVLITAIGVSLLLENLGQLVFGKSVVPFPQLPDSHFTLLGVTVRHVEVAAILTSFALMFGLQALVYRTKVGRAMRAVSIDEKVAGLMGIPVDRIVSVTFVIGSALAAAGGLLVGLTYGQLKQPADASWILYGLKAFVAAVIGGIGNVPGAMLGGLLLGLAEQFVAGLVSSTFRDAVAFGLLIVILLVRPTGLLGARRIVKV